MMKSEEEARQACIVMVDALVNNHKKNISELDIYAEVIDKPNKLYGLDVYVCKKSSTEKWRKKDARE